MNGALKGETFGRKVEYPVITLKLGLTQILRFCEHTEHHQTGQPDWIFECRGQARISWNLQPEVPVTATTSIS